MTDDDRLSESENRAEPVKRKRRFWHLHLSTMIIFISVIVLLAMMIIPGQKSTYIRSNIRHSKIDKFEQAKFRFHGWPAIHMVTIENYELYDSDLTSWGRIGKLELGGGNMPNFKTKLSKGDLANQKLAHRSVDKAYEEYELNSHFWPRPARINLNENDPSPFAEITSRYPNWMDASNWALGMKRKIQWQGVAINFSLAFGILLAVVFISEYLRRRKNSFWQISILEFGVLVALISVAVWFLSTKYKTAQAVADLSAKGIVERTQTIAEPVWLHKIVGPRFCTSFDDIDLDMANVSDADRVQLGRLQHTTPWHCHIKSFSGEDVDAVGVVPSISSLWLTLAQSPGEIDWKEVSFGPNLADLMISTFDCNEKMLASSKLKTKARALNPGNPVDFKYETISFDPFDYASKASKDLQRVSVSGFLIDAEFIECFAANKQFTRLGLGSSRITDGAYYELLKLPKLESLEANHTENLTYEQVAHLNARHGHAN